MRLCDCAHLKLLVVPGDDGGTAELAVHAEGAHLPLQSLPQLLPGLQVPDEVGPGVVELESSGDAKREVRVGDAGNIWH